jgi:ParB-like chromosome segregation protein Spo0J
MPKTTEVRGLDIPIGQLRALNERKPSQRAFQRLLATIRAIGLIEPVCVYKEGDHHVILDGYLRYLACLEFGVETVPCLLYRSKEAYTFNRMVNILTPIQEHRMLEKSLETLDAKTIAQAFGVRSISGRNKKSLLAKLSNEAAKEYDSGRITRTCAIYLTQVKPERQTVIVKEMAKVRDFSAGFARAMVIRTPAPLRAKLGPKAKNPWSKEDVKQEYMMRFAEVTHQYKFHAGLYRIYVADLMKLYVHVRKLVANDRVQSYLSLNSPETLKMFNAIVFEARNVGAEVLEPAS